MNAIVVEGNSKQPQLHWKPVADPIPGPEEVLVQVKAAGVNRADLLQARGGYAPPPGTTDILGLEASGVVEATGERVCFLLPGGGYAERVAVHRDMLLPLPAGWSFATGASVCEAWLTAFVNLFQEGALAPGESVLIHAGASGVGLAAIQLARFHGAIPYVTVRTPEKAGQCQALGATVLGADFDSTPVDLILDCVGGSYLERNIAALKPFGRLVNIGLLGGSKGELNLNHVLRKRLRIVGSTLRSRPRSEQIAITAAFRERFWRRLVTGEAQLIVDRVFAMQEAGAAHAYMEQNRNTGKIVLVIE